MRSVKQWRLTYATTGPTRVPAIGTTRRIRALLAIGWTTDLIAERLGLGNYTVRDWLYRDAVYKSTAEKIAAVYDEWSMIVGPSDLGRRRAARKGWPPPLAWDDDTIDDPDAKPATGRNTRCPSVADNILFLASWGVTRERIAERLGVTVSAVERALERRRTGAA